MINIVTATEFAWYREGGLFEIFGVDFILDENLNLWLIEVNSSPSMDNTSSIEKFKLKARMLSEMFEIEFALLRSRTRKILGFLADFVKAELKNYYELPINAQGTGSFENFLKRQIEEKFEKIFEEFLSINQDAFSEEFPEPKGLSWRKIIDQSVGNETFFHPDYPEECRDML